MAKRKSRKKKKQTDETLRKLISALPGWLLVLIVCLGVCFGVLAETGVLRLSDVQGALGFTDAADSADIPESARDFSVNVIDVGQGDSILILAGGKSILIDAGEKEYGGRVVSYARSMGADRLDYIIATHPHSDHIGGMAEVIRELGADRIIVPKLPDSMIPTTRVYEDFLLAVKDSGSRLTAAKAGKVYDIAEINGKKVTMTVLTPVEGAEYSDLNNYSVSVRIDYGNISWLLTGDLSEAGERDLIKSGADIDTDAYKVAHHGSAGASTAGFLSEVTPAVCVISCGAGNSYGHPSDKALNRISRHTGNIYRTDMSSTVSIYSDGERFYAVTAK